MMRSAPHLLAAQSPCWPHSAASGEGDDCRSESDTDGEVLPHCQTGGEPTISVAKGAERALARGVPANHLIPSRVRSDPAHCLTGALRRANPDPPGQGSSLWGVKSPSVPRVGPSSR